MNRCECGTEFILLSYHHRKQGTENICHSCYRKYRHTHFDLFDVVEFTARRLGFNSDLNVAWAEAGDTGIIGAYDDELGYVVHCQGFVFRAEGNMLKRGKMRNLSRIPKTPKRAGEIMLESIQQELKTCSI